MATAASDDAVPPPAAGADDIAARKKRLFKAAMRQLAVRRFVAEDHQPALVAPNLYIGSIGAAQNREALRAHGITHVVCAAAGLKCEFPDELT